MLDTRTQKRKRQKRHQHHSAPSKDERKVGVLFAKLAPRPCPSFQRNAKHVAQEFDRIARQLFTADGSRCIVRDDLVGTEGGIIYLNRIEVSDWGIDLGLRLMHETLVFVKDLWSVVIMQPTRHSHAEDCNFTNNQLRQVLKAKQCKQDQLEDYKNLMTHFARMGFLQLGKNKNHYQVLFLPHDLYFKTDPRPPSWITKEEAALDLYFPPLNLDNELRVLMDRLCWVFESQVLTEEDNALISRLATRDRIDSEGFFHYLASNWQNRHLFDLFAENGGNVNLTLSEECGRSPLHRAAMVGNRIGFQALVEHGADHQVQDLSGRTPLDYYLDHVRESHEDEEDEDDSSSDDSSEFGDDSSEFGDDEE
jgi:hypothetical protein